MDCVQPCCRFFRASLLAAGVLKTWFRPHVQSIRPVKAHCAAHLSSPLVTYILAAIFLQ
jgi:hypothetical protein